MRHLTLLLLLAVLPQVVRSDTNNQLPVVTITMDNYAQVLPVGTPVTLHVQAHDPDGTVESVRAFHGAASLGNKVGTNGIFSSVIQQGENLFRGYAHDDSNASAA